MISDLPKGNLYDSRCVTSSSQTACATRKESETNPKKVRRFPSSIGAFMLTERPKTADLSPIDSRIGTNDEISCRGNDFCASRRRCHVQRTVVGRRAVNT